ncbi:MAG: FAD-dependent oxidoreductase, partial [Terriglobales bacterium]
FAGQISGVEGYVESIAMGLLAGLHAAALARGAVPLPPPRSTAFGSLVNYITQSDAHDFQPANITFDLLPSLEKKVRDRAVRHRLQCERALAELETWLREFEKRFLPLRAESPTRLGPTLAGMKPQR